MNNRNNLLTLLIVSLIIILIAIIIIVLILSHIDNSNNKDKNNNIIIDEQVGDIGEVERYGILENNKLTNSLYFDINQCINQYLSLLNTKDFRYYERNDNGEFVLKENGKIIYKSIYNLLSETYIKENNITLENIMNYIKLNHEKTLYVPLEAKEIQSGNITSFIAHGFVENLDYKVIDEIYIIVNISTNNMSFSIEPIIGKYKSINEIPIEELETTVNKNANNTFEMSDSLYENIAKDYINLYKRLVLGAPEKMYELLDSEYKNVKFGTIDNFKKYIEENKDKIIGIRLEQFLPTKENDYTQYLCVDQYGSYYIFREKQVLDYTVLLDNYTIDSPEFLKEYNKASDDKKVGYNIEKIFNAINLKDYKYVYNKLDETFKNNNFNTFEIFEKYMTENLYSNNVKEYKDYKKQGDIHIYTIDIYDKDNNNNEAIKMNIMMKLREGTDFVMSFGIE